MTKRDSYLLRIKPEMLEALRRWADDEFRSLNGQIECVLHKALEYSGRLPKVSTPSEPQEPDPQSQEYPQSQE
ncbi:MAG: Arc family DNA-binding protein [Planctomycetota bacterium]|nr:Arc family DNA-binding protein [Planctomycetota bacterium]